MNRRYRRALSRTKRRNNPRKLKPQRCALWVPSAGGYIAQFEPGRFVTVEYAELAQLYEENAAARTALAFRQATGLHVAVRPVYAAANRGALS